MNEPTRTGPHIFIGIRYSSTKKFIQTGKRLVCVKESRLGGEMYTVDFGSSKRFPLSKYEGIWTYVGSLLDE